jgi:hypothetical protein
LILITLPFFVLFLFWAIGLLSFFKGRRKGRIYT